MLDLLIVVDMQTDFIEGPLSTDEARAILPRVKEVIKEYRPEYVIFTRDSHQDDYLETQEGQKLPIPHCIIGTPGWQIHPELEALRRNAAIDKPTFGSWQLGEYLRDLNTVTPIHSIKIIGVCTDICVISNAMLLRAALPETEIIVDASACAGVTPEAHRTALNALKATQTTILNE